MAVEGIGGGSRGIAILVAAGLVFEAIAFACSSPQTTELNAARRAETLMKWVHLGQAAAAGLVIVAAVSDSKNRGPILFGGIVAMAIAEGYYVHAKQSGLAKGGAPTEDW